MDSQESSASEYHVQSILQQALAYRQTGVDRGLYGGNVLDALKAFKAAQNILHQTTVCEPIVSQALVETLIAETELYIQLCDWDTAKQVLIRALAVHESCKPACRVTAKVLLADLYCCLSVVEHNMSNAAAYQEWDKKGAELLQEALKEDPDNIMAQSLYGLFLSYQTSDEQDGVVCLELGRQAVETLGRLHTQDPTNRTHALRLACALRLASLGLRTHGQPEEAATAARGALDLATQMTERYPTAPRCLVELYYCHLAVAELGENTRDDCRAIWASRQAGAEALIRLTSIVPTVARRWRNLSSNIREMAVLQERMGNMETAWNTAVRALRASETAVACANQGWDEDLEYAVCLLECGRLGYHADHLDDALGYYERAYSVYSEKVLTDPKGADEEEFYAEQLARSMYTAHSCAKQVDQEEKALNFLRKCCAAAQSLKIRKNRVMHACHLHDLAKHLTTMDRREEAITLFSGALERLEPLYRKYPWHFTVGICYRDCNLGLAKCYQQMDSEVEKELAHRRAFLTFQGRLHGKDYSEWLQSEQDEDISNVDMEELRDVCSSSPGIKKFNVKCRSEDGKTVTSHTVFVASAIVGRDPLEDQARVLLEDHGVKIPEDVRESVRKLQELALRNNMSLQDITEYALSDSSNDDDDGGTAATADETLGSIDDDSVDECSCETGEDNGEDFIDRIEIDIDQDLPLEASGSETHDMC